MAEKSAHARGADATLPFAIKRSDHLHDILQLLIAQLRIDRKGKDLFSRPLRLRKRTFG